MATLRRPAALLFGALLASACQDPAPTTGTLVVSVTGLPSGTNAAVRVAGPNQFRQLVPVTVTLENLVPGDYIVFRDTVFVSNTRYGVDSAVVRDTVAITRGRTESIVAPYQIASGTLTVTAVGLPSDAFASLRIRGPLPSSQVNGPITAGIPVTALRPGLYEVSADTATSSAGDRFSTIQFRDTVTVAASLTPTEATVSFVLASGMLSLTVNGLPASVSSQAITVTGPGGYEVRTGQSTTLRGLSPGTYSISAANVNGTCPDIYSTSNVPQSRDVTVGQTSDVTVTYSASAVSAADLNLQVLKVYLTQATQNADGSVPLLTGKTALLRVFGIANQCNTAKPQVRVTLSTGPQFTIDATEDSVRVAQDEGSLTASWNAIVPASAVQAGMTVVAEMDVTNVAAEANEGDNRFPASGGHPIDVRTAPVVGLRLVPIAQTVNDVLLTGVVNVEQFMEWPRKLHPVGTYDVDVRETYTTTTAALTSSGSNWTTVLSEVRNLRTADSSSRYYYGVARVTYNAGVAGIAYVPGTTGLGWDHQPSGSRVLAHELGHNFGRFHSPCGGPSGVDESYPSTGDYFGGRIGAVGWDPIEGLKRGTAFTDVMGYCNNQWISDYTYVGMLDWISDPNRAPSLPSTKSTVDKPSLLIWGRIENGLPVLEPAFEINTRPQPPVPGPHRITATDAGGAQLFSVAFAGERIADLPGEHETFSFTVPISALRGRDLASLSLTARGRTVTSVASADVGSDPRAVTSQAGSRAMRIRWDATRFPVVMVRNPANGQVLSFARGGDVTIATSRTELELNFSNRVRSSRRLMQLK